MKKNHFKFYLILFIIIMSYLLFFVSYNRNSEYITKKINNTSFYYSKNLDTSDMKNYIILLNNINPKLLENCKNIYIESSSISKKANVDYLLDGFTLENNIYINGNKENTKVLVHELFHIFDFSNNNLSSQYDFLNIYEMNNLSNNNNNTSNNISELFADFGVLYIYDKDFKSNNYKIYNYFDNLLK